MTDAPQPRRDVFASRVTSEEDLRALLGWPGEPVRRKVLPALRQSLQALTPMGAGVVASARDAALGGVYAGRPGRPAGHGRRGRRAPAGGLLRQPTVLIGRGLDAPDVADRAVEVGQE